MVTTRRRFLQTAAAGGALAGFGDLGFLGRLRPVSADETALDPNIVQMQPDIEPLVRLLEETPRERLLEGVAGKIKAGTTYREVLAALLLAGVRNVQPRPSVGFKFHAVLVVNSAHLASLASPDEHRWLPIFWALDEFKQSQAQDVRENDWTMRPVDEARLPPAEKAREAFISAMDNWDEEAADVAVAALARSMPPAELFEIFCRYGARDFRSIGHKAIYVANSWRTLDHIGWQYAEPVLRSLAYALLMYDDGGAKPSEADYEADRPGRENVARAAALRADWQQGQADEAATAELLATMYAGSPDDCCGQVVEMLNRGVAPQSIWDAMYLSAGEMLVRQPGIVGLHCVTSTNALAYSFRASQSDDNKRLLLLQNAAFLPMFLQAMHGRGQVADVHLTELEPAPLEADGAGAVAEIFNTAGSDRMAAARKIIGYVREQPDPAEFIEAARLLVFLKGTNSHDYKFSSAVLEDYLQVSPVFRDRYLASSVFNLRTTADGDNGLVQRTRDALA